MNKSSSVVEFELSSLTANGSAPAGHGVVPTLAGDENLPTFSMPATDTSDPKIGTGSKIMRRILSIYIGQSGRVWKHLSPSVRNRSVTRAWGRHLESVAGFVFPPIVSSISPRSFCAIVPNSSCYTVSRSETPGRALRYDGAGLQQRSGSLLHGVGYPYGAPRSAAERACHRHFPGNRGLRPQEASIRSAVPTRWPPRTKRPPNKKGTSAGTLRETRMRRCFERVSAQEIEVMFRDEREPGDH